MTAGPAPRSGSGACSALPTGERTAPPTSAGPPPAGDGAAPDGSGTGTGPDAPAAELRPAAEDRWAGELAALAAADTASGAEVPAGWRLGARLRRRGRGPGGDPQVLRR